MELRNNFPEQHRLRGSDDLEEDHDCCYDADSEFLPREKKRLKCSLENDQESQQPIAEAEAESGQSSSSGIPKEEPLWSSMVDFDLKLVEGSSSREDEDKASLSTWDGPLRSAIFKTHDQIAHQEQQQELAHEEITTQLTTYNAPR